MPVVEVVRRSCRVMNGKVLTEVTPWNGDNIVFVPEENSVSLRTPMQTVS